MPKTKKPPNGPGKNRAVVSTTVDLETSAEIDRLAAAGGLTRSQWAREALTEIATEATIYGITKKTEVTKLSGNAAPLKSSQKSSSKPSNDCSPVGAEIATINEPLDSGSAPARRPSSRQAG
jgi:hypothetical protein